MIKKRIEYWEKCLLDLGKRNKLVNFKETLRSSIEITRPEFFTLFNHLVVKEKELKFSQLKYKIVTVDDQKVLEKYVIPGDLKTNREIEDQNTTLKAIRNKCKTIFQEQGVNVLYLSFGFLNWNDLKDKTIMNKSPLLLVPLHLVQRSIIDPFKIFLGEDEIVLNPTLHHKLLTDFNVNLPAFDNAGTSIKDYLSSIGKMIKKHSWSIEYKTFIGVFLFHKINMYKDLHSKEARIAKNDILKGLCGEKVKIPQFSKNFISYDHDSKTKPEDTFQVLQADSSQQDAVLFAKNGYSFVLQGPPGTGKSQTIANIISESLAEGKKVLFVSDKMAALEVVYKRLESVGLSDYCLTLHNPRIKKTDFLSDIKRVLEKKKIQTNGNVKRDLIKLANQKAQLIEYNKALHKKIKPLNKTIYEACSEFLLLKNIADIDFPILDSHKDSEEEYIHKIGLLEEYVNCISNMSTKIIENPWFGFKLLSTTHDEREEIKLQFNDSLTCNRMLIEAVEYFNEVFRTNFDATYSNTENIKVLLQILVQLPAQFPEHYLAFEDFNSLYDLIHKNIKLCKDLSNTKNQLDSEFSPTIYKLDSKKLFKLLHECIDFLEDHLSVNTFPSKNDIFTNIEHITVELDALKCYPEKISMFLDTLETKYGLIVEKETFDWSLLKTKLKAILELPKPCKSWLNEEYHASILRTLDQCCGYSHSLNSLESQVNEIFDPDIFNEDIDVLLRNFRSSYVSFSRIFKPQYYKDKKTIQQYVKSKHDRVGHSEICELLESLKKIQTIKSWFSKNRDNLRSLFDEYYEDYNTNWDAIKERFINFKNILSKFLGINHSNSLLFQKLDVEVREIQAYIDFISECEVNNISTRFEKLLNTHIFSEGFRKIADTALVKQLYVVSEKLQRLNILLEIKEALPKNFDFYEKSLSLLVYYQELEEEYRASFDKLKEIFGYLFKETKTDWSTLLSIIQWVENWQKTPHSNSISHSSIEEMCVDNSFKQNVNRIYQEIQSLHVKFLPLHEWFQIKFHKPFFSPNKQLRVINKQLEDCQNRFYLLNEYHDYMTHKKKCSDMGLGPYLTYVDKVQMNFNEILNSYKKAFISSWIDTSLDLFPPLLNFQKAAFKRLVNSFNESDVKHINFTPLLILEKIQKKLPNNFDITSPDSEIGILKREMLKKRRIMPLRLLFSRIPNLLKAYKPCFMMSPLSVSLFLESDAYQFDLVIFDEASQVKTEDAVGAILRGNQIIVCGDQHQLPPSSFFSTRVGENEYDDDDEDSLEEFEIDSSGNYDSVLEECKKILPEITLRWHYRSRDEKLIAFSNKSIYDNRLITFPSNVQRTNDYGVELVYCENGRYDKGRSRTNRIEARKVAELVFKHFDKHPDRSIGVVTFSIAQQNAVDQEITNLRIENQEYEEYFDENKNESFFIKNLETVQGDERDTIILCIGYGKHEENKPISMSFGPLNISGGERRLNVAITRAKCNIKIVTSISSFDFDLSRTKSKGVKLLKEYIAFAENRCIIEENPLNDENENLHDIEGYVCQCLDQNGVHYKRNVGFSNYKIDIAIPYSNNPDHFILAIETEGDQFVSARTERERYLTRHNILQSMGWSIEHIWTPILLQDPEGESKKLIQKIKSLDKEYSKKQHLSVARSNIEHSHSISKSPKNKTHYDNKKYYEVDKNNDLPSFGLKYYEISKIPENIVYMGSCIRHVLEKESPIHIELLCHRIAPKFNRKKVTKLFIDQVKKELSLMDHYNYNRSSGFIYKTDEEIIARIPSEKEPETFRSNDHLPNEEITLVTKTILRDCFSITKEGLIDTTARLFGFNRTGELIYDRFSKIIDKMIRNKIIKKNQDTITLIEDDS